jgi:hypothetical protein
VKNSVTDDRFCFRDQGRSLKPLRASAGSPSRIVQWRKDPVLPAHRCGGSAGIEKCDRDDRVSTLAIIKDRKRELLSPASRFTLHAEWRAGHLWRRAV